MARSVVRRTRVKTPPSEAVLVVGSNEGPRPSVDLVASLLGRPADDFAVPHAGSKIVQFVANPRKVDVFKHRLCSSGLWCDVKRSPAQSRTLGEWKEIMKWAQQHEASLNVDSRVRTITSGAGTVVVKVSKDAEHITWLDTPLRLRWLGRPKE